MGDSNALTIENLQIEISTKSAEALKGISNTTQALQELKVTTRGGIKGLSSIAKQLDELNAAISAMPDLTKLEQLRDVLAQIKGLGNLKINANVTTPATQGLTDVKNAAQVPINGGIESGTPETNFANYDLQDFLQEVQEISAQQERLEADLERNLQCFDQIGASGSSNFKSVRKAVEGANKGVNKFFASLKRIALYRAIRAVLKAITSAFKEGLQNIAQYSSEANYTLSQLSTVSLQLKNSLGAMLMPIIQNFTPLLIGMAQAAMYVINALNMLVSLLSGKGTYTKAIAYWQDYTKSVNEAKKALTGFDEINILGENTPDYSSMFEEVDISFGDMAGGLAAIAGATAAVAGLAAVLKGTGLSGFISNIKTIGGLLLVVLGTMEAIQGIVSIWNDGASWENTIQSILGMTAAVGGLALMFGQVGAKIGLAIAAVTLLTAGIKDMIENGIGIENVTLVVGGLIAAVVLLGLQFGAVGASIGLILASITTLILGIIKYVQSWGQMSLWQKIVAGILLVAAAACAVWAIYEAIKGNYVMAGVAAAIGIGVAIGGVAVIDCFAEGGFPEKGQLFIANEAGPELVGTMNGHSTVANNNQIIDGIKQGVMEAMANSDFGGDWTINVIDNNGRIKASQIVTAAQRKNRRDGKTVIQLGN